MKQYKILLLLVVAMAVASCGTTKRLAYIQDMEPDVTYSMPVQPDAIIAKGDKVSIIVTCSSPALAAPFNIVSGISVVDPTSAGVVSGMVTDNNAGGITKAGSDSQQGYEVDNDGCINFPVLGRMQVEGMTLKNLKSQLEAELVKRRYIKDPVVLITFVNFHVTVLGEAVANVYNIPSGRANIFELVAMAGDLTEDAIRDDIWVVRTVDGKRRLYTINLKTKDCYYSPAFFLQQNDMVYIKPKKNKFDETINNRWTVINSLIGVIGTALNAMLWFNYMAK